MRRSTSNLAASVHQRLLNKARESGRPFNELLQYFAIERFIYRLSKSPKGTNFILKGALMFFVWNHPGSRPTLDIDLAGKFSNNPDEITSAMQEACTTPVDPDGLSFEPASVRAAAIIEEAQYQGIRTHRKGNQGKAEIYLQVDTGFGDAIVPEAVNIIYPTLLDFPSARFKGYTMKSTIAEKFQALVTLGVINSRMKDFYDVWLLSESYRFEGERLGQALTATFTTRNTPFDEIPSLFDASFPKNQGKETQWRSFLDKSKSNGGPEQFSQTHMDGTRGWKTL